MYVITGRNSCKMLISLLCMKLKDLGTLLIGLPSLLHTRSSWLTTEFQINCRLSYESLKKRLKYSYSHSTLFNILVKMTWHTDSEIVYLKIMAMILYVEEKTWNEINPESFSVASFITLSNNFYPWSLTFVQGGHLKCLNNSKLKENVCNSKLWKLSEIQLQHSRGWIRENFELLNFDSKLSTNPIQ